MQDKEVCKIFGLRLKMLRKQKKWTQKELASRLDVGFSLLNKYECGLHIPPADKLMSLAQLFDTTVDYLLGGKNDEEVSFHNTKIIERLKALENFNPEDQETVIKLIDAMIVKQKVETFFSPTIGAKL